MKIKLSNISIEITSVCNINCKYCYNHWKTSESDYYSNSYKKAHNTLKQLFKFADVETITFTGGEPFLSERFEENILYARLQNKRVNIISNGNACSDDQLMRMISMGVQLFEFPFHSAQSEIHDAMTCKKGSWQKSLNSILSITKHKGYVVPVIVLTKFNYQLIEETIEYLFKLGLYRIMINRFNIGGNGIKAKEELTVSINDLRDTFGKINSLASKFKLNISSNVCTPFCVLNPLDYPNIAFGSCPSNVLFRPLTLDIEGNLRLCNHSPIIAGNIFKSELSSILYSDYAESWNNSKPIYCLNCEKLDICFGGCRAASEQLNKTLSDVDPIIECFKTPSC